MDFHVQRKPILDLLRIYLDVRVLFLPYEEEMRLLCVLPTTAVFTLCLYFTETLTPSFILSALTQTHIWTKKHSDVFQQVTRHLGACIFFLMEFRVCNFIPKCRRTLLCNEKMVVGFPRMCI